MGDWYQVTKTINGRKYLYWQKTYRVGRSVKTLNKYIGPGANPPRMRSLAAQMANLPDAHKKLRAEYDAGAMTKTQYLEAISSKPHTHHYVWQIAPDEDGNTIKQCECGDIGEIEVRKSSVEKSAAGSGKINPDDIPW